MSAEVFIPLTQGKITVIDFEDFEKVRPYKWHARRDKNRTYAATNSKNRRTVRLHRLLMDAKEGQEVDHKDGDGLNNHRGNLRFCTNHENARNAGKSLSNTSGFKGVRRHKTSRGWQAYIQTGSPKRFFHLGIFLTAKEAARAYDTAAIEYFGNFARLNFSSSAHVKSSPASIAVADKARV
jgi:hypothetical protein